MVVVTRSVRLCFLLRAGQEHGAGVSKETRVSDSSSLEHPHPTKGTCRVTALRTNWRGKSPEREAGSPYLTLQLVSFLGTAEPQVFGQGRVLGERAPVVLVAGQALSLLGMHQGHHVQWQMELRL